MMRELSGLLGYPVRLAGNGEEGSDCALRVAGRTW